MKWSPRLTLFAGCLTAVAAVVFPTHSLIPRVEAADPQAAAVQPALLAAKELQLRETWRKSLLQVPTPSKGCFTAVYPDKTWKKVACAPTTPHKLFLPHGGGITQIDTVGGSGPDYSATVTGHISLAEGSFDSVSGVTSNNPYSLQLNTQHFATGICSGSPNNTGSLTTGCRGWEQFVYENNGSAFIQYWILDFGPVGTACPLPHPASCPPGTSTSAGWCAVNLPLFVGDPNPIQCVINAANQPAAPAKTMAQVGDVKVAGSATGTGDSISITNGANPPSIATGDNRLPGLNTGWNEAEFNAFGGGNSAATNFNSGANLVVRTQVISGTNAGPGCDLRSFTGESTNLSLSDTPPASPGPPGPALVFSQSFPAPPGTPACAGAASIGDTHQTTFGGLLYDFQAAGDFVLADTGRDFLVETRQVSGAPTWPNADVNSAVAVKTGGHRVAVCIPERVVVDGKPATFRGDKTRVSFAGGGGVVYKNGTYVVFSAGGDTMRATINGTHIDVGVGLGKWPSTVRGLLANANTVNQIKARTGQVFTANFSYDDIYHTYADSWRVPPRETLLSDCGPPGKDGIASAPFYADNLDPALAKRVRSVCQEAGVKAGPLLDACMIDVAFAGAGAAKAYIGARPPVAVGLIVKKGANPTRK